MDKDSFISVIPRIDKHTKYKIFINGDISDTYKFNKKSIDYSYSEIEIHLEAGAIKFEIDLCWCYYPTHDGNYMPLKQMWFCDWFHGINCDINKWYYGKQILKFYHLYLQGPSYFRGTEPIYNYKPVLGGEFGKSKLNTLKLKEILKL